MIVAFIVHGHGFFCFLNLLPNDLVFLRWHVAKTTAGLLWREDLYRHHGKCTWTDAELPEHAVSKRTKLRQQASATPQALDYYA